MSEKVIKTITKTTDHPLEEFFDIEENTTEIVVKEQKTSLIVAPEYDEKDVEIEEDFQDIQDKAISAHEMLQDQIEDSDPKYVPRLSEISNQLLQTALSAISEKAKIKIHKDKIAAKENTSPQIVNQTLIMDRNDALAKIRSKEIDVSPKPKDDNKNEDNN